MLVNKSEIAKNADFLYAKNSEQRKKWFCVCQSRIGTHEANQLTKSDLTSTFVLECLEQEKSYWCTRSSIWTAEHSTSTINVLF